MTEEIIIINGVNVAGCNFRLERDNKQKCECCHATGFGVICDCEVWHNCYYKQLQGIKQQNLELIERANAYPKIVILANERLTEIARLEQENKELKEKNATLEDKLQLRMASDKESDAFWDEIFSEKDYPFNKENAYKELKDYYFVLEQLPKIYMEITGGTLSKTTYFASSVVEAYNDALDRYYDKIDDLEYDNNAYRSALEEIREDIRSFYGCEDSSNDYKLVNMIDKINEVLNAKS